ncbi:hypothetical protein GCM10027596_31530 [Nocardioides korecus]
MHKALACKVKMIVSHRDYVCRANADVVGSVVLRPVCRVSGRHPGLPPGLERVGVTYPQYPVLLVLWERGMSTVQEVASKLRLDHGTLTPCSSECKGRVWS